MKHVGGGDVVQLAVMAPCGGALDLILLDYLEPFAFIV